MRDFTLYKEPIRKYSPSDEEFELFHGYEGEFDEELYSNEAGHGHGCRCSICRESEEAFNLYTEFEQDLLDEDFDFELESSAYPGISCITPGNPYVLHCFPPFKSELTKEQHKHLDIIAKKIQRSFSTSTLRPITKVMIVGHSSTWHKTPRSKLEERAFQRAGNAGEQLILRLYPMGLAKRVKVETDGRSYKVRWLGKPYSSKSGSQKAQNDRALNRRVEIFLFPTKKKKKILECDKRKLARRLLDLNREIRRGGARTIRTKRILCIIRLLTSHLVDGERVDDCFVDTLPPFGKLRCKKRLLHELCRRDLDDPARFRKAFDDLYNQIKRPLERTRLNLIKIGSDTPSDAVVNSAECSFVRLFKKKARDKRSIYFCFEGFIEAFGTQCDVR